MRVLQIILLLVLLAPLGGCPKVCDSGATPTRCESGFVEICTSKGRWHRFADCAAVRGHDGKTRPGECRMAKSGRGHICGARP
jgi:hypothetical protein